MPFAEALVIIISQSKKVVARCSIVSLYSAINSVTGLGGKVDCGLSQKNYQAATFVLGERGGNATNGNFLHGIAPNRAIDLEIYIKKQGFCPSKMIVQEGFPPRGHFLYTHFFIRIKSIRILRLKIAKI